MVGVVMRQTVVVLAALGVAFSGCILEAEDDAPASSAREQPAAAPAAAPAGEVAAPPAPPAYVVSKLAVKWTSGMAGEICQDSVGCTGSPIGFDADDKSGKYVQHKAGLGAPETIKLVATWKESPQPYLGPTQVFVGVYCIIPPKEYDYCHDGHRDHNHATLAYAQGATGTLTLTAVAPVPDPLPEGATSVVRFGILPRSAYATSYYYNERIDFTVEGDLMVVSPPAKA